MSSWWSTSSSSSISALRRSRQQWMPHSDVGGVWLNPGKNLDPNGHSRWLQVSFWQFLSPYHHYLSLLSACYCLKRPSLEVRVTTIYVATRNFGKVPCHIIPILPIALAPHQFASRANRWKLLQQLSGLFGGTFSRMKAVQGWFFCQFVAPLWKQSSPTHWCPNWQNWTWLHPSAARSSISFQNPSQSLRVAPPSLLSHWLTFSRKTSALRKNLVTEAKHTLLPLLHAECVLVCVCYSDSGVITSTQKIIGCPPPSLGELLSTQCLRKAKNIPRDPPSQVITRMNCCPQANGTEQQK